MPHENILGWEMWDDRNNLPITDIWEHILPCLCFKIISPIIYKWQVSTGISDQILYTEKTK